MMCKKHITIDSTYDVRNKLNRIRDEEGFRNRNELIASIIIDFIEHEADFSPVFDFKKLNVPIFFGVDPDLWKLFCDVAVTKNVSPSMLLHLVAEFYVNSHDHVKSHDLQ